ncbi:MAG: phospholipase D-like domain-containing protein, partial [Planctomycetota bacterium]|nr:phospholipase D-like domain-containing protein [Planctomycetota bacterium]
GIQVRVIIPGESDVKMVHRATRYMYSHLLKHGIEIYERKDQMLHSKVLVIDDDWSVVGSCNLDPRSLRINLEFMAAIRSEQFATSVRSVCEHEMQNSRQVTTDCLEKLSWYDRLMDRIAWMFRRLL